jgi:hypothetical protein
VVPEEEGEGFVTEGERRRSLRRQRERELLEGVVDEGQPPPRLISSTYYHIWTYNPRFYSHRLDEGQPPTPGQQAKRPGGLQGGGKKPAGKGPMKKIERGIYDTGGSKKSSSSRNTGKTAPRKISSGRRLSANPAKAPTGALLGVC